MVTDAAHKLMLLASNAFGIWGTADFGTHRLQWSAYRYAEALTGACPGLGIGMALALALAWA